MARLPRLRSRVSLRVVAGLISVALHFGLFSLILFTGDRYEGTHDSETPTSQVVLLESHLTERQETAELPALPPPMMSANLHAQLATQNTPPPTAVPGNLPVESDNAAVAPPDELIATHRELPRTIDSPSTFVMPQAEASALVQRLTRLAEELVKTPQSQVAWEQDGRQYSAKLILERANDGIAFDHALAEVSAQDRGKQLTTRVMLKRLAFSHFTQIVDRWDPMVQLHDDEIVGRFHINSRFNLMYDRQAVPKFLGKVTTAARSFSAESSGHRRQSDIFQGGIETGTSRIALPTQVQPFDWAPRDANARLHELTDDTRIRFFADGSYSWREQRSGTAQYRNEPSDQPVYFVATRGATIYVQGVVSGKILVYSPQRIVVAGGLTYAHDPRDTPDSRDYLGLVCDRDIEVAPPFVTGAGDLDIHAAIYAGRRFIVTDIDQARTATLRIYGSLAAGSLSASEPRYAMKVAYDSRLEQQRPPGFPSTNRFTADDWDGQWTEATQEEGLAHTVQ